MCTFLKKISAFFELIHSGALWMLLRQGHHGAFIQRFSWGLERTQQQKRRNTAFFTGNMAKVAVFCDYLW